MPAYFASDVHLRLDRPERGRRLARWVESFEPDDSLTLGGDLCDFWFAARQVAGGASLCPGLQALAAFRARGGSVAFLPGNHDLWLSSFYRDVFDPQFLEEPARLEVFGQRIHLVHGHLLGGRRIWKAGMESHAFLTAFRNAPSRLANQLDRILEHSNERSRFADEERHLALYRRYAADLPGAIDLVVIGHVHRAVDEVVKDGRRLVVLGGWQRQSSFLKIDPSGATFVVEPEAARIPC